MNSDATFAAANARLRKNRIGSIGCGRPQLPGDERGEEHGAGGERADDLGLVQPSPLPRMRPQTIPSRPALASARPGRSSALSGPVRLAAAGVARAGASTSPIGTLSQKIHCQEMPSTTAPPTSGPEGDGEAGDAAPRRRARARASRGGTAALRIVSVSGITIAPPSP